MKRFGVIVSRFKEVDALKLNRTESFCYNTYMLLGISIGIGIS